MDNKNLIIVIESIILVILIGFLIYGYSQYNTLNENYNNLGANYNTLKTEFDSFTDFGTAKIKLPIDSDYEAILVAQNTKEYENFFIKEMLSNERDSTNLYFSLTKKEIGGKRIYTIVAEANAPSLREFILIVDAETGEIISSES